MSGDRSLLQDTDDRGDKDGSPSLLEGDSGPKKTVIAHPVPSGGFSTSSVRSEEFVKELGQIRECLESSSEVAMQTEQKSEANGQAEDNAPKGEKEASNRALRFQIQQPDQSTSRCKCRRSKKAKSCHRTNSTSRGCHHRQSESLTGHCNRRRHRHHHHHHHHRHNHRNKEGHRSSSTSSELKNRRHCGRQATSASELPRRDKTAVRAVPSRSRVHKRREGKHSHQRQEGDTEHHHVSRNKCHEKLEFFSRYKSSCSSDTPSSSSSDEDSPVADAWESRKHSRKAPAPEVDTLNNVQEVPQDDEHGQLESTVEKHVLELNFPRATGLESICNLLEHCHCPYNNEKDGCCDDKFVHCMRTGQTCELRGDTQVIRVSLPGPHKVMVEHVLKKASAQRVECPAGTVPYTPNEKRSRSSRHCHRTVTERADGPMEAPRFRRRHSYKRHTTRHHGGDSPKLRDFAFAGAATEVHSETSSEEDSSSEDDNDRTDKGKMAYTEKGVEAITVSPSVKTVRHSGQRSPRRCPGGFENKEAWRRQSGRHKCAASGVQDVAVRKSSSPRRISVSSTVSLAPEEEAEDGNTFRIVFTDSSLNTELRCILQDGVGKDRHRSSMTFVRDAPCKRPPQQHRRTRRVRAPGDDSNHETVPVGRPGKNVCPTCDCNRPLQPARPGFRRPDPRPCTDASDLVSSSYYSSTHESSLALNDSQTDCKLCDTLSAAAAANDCLLGCGSRRPKGNARNPQRRRL